MEFDYQQETFSRGIEVYVPGRDRQWLALAKVEQIAYARSLEVDAIMKVEVELSNYNLFAEYDSDFVVSEWPEGKYATVAAAKDAVAGLVEGECVAVELRLRRLSAAADADADAFGQPWISCRAIGGIDTHWSVRVEVEEPDEDRMQSVFEALRNAATHVRDSAPSPKGPRSAIPKRQKGWFARAFDL